MIPWSKLSFSNMSSEIPQQVWNQTCALLMLHLKKKGRRDKHVFERGIYWSQSKVSVEVVMKEEKKEGGCQTHPWRWEIPQGGSMMGWAAVPGATADTILTPPLWGFNHKRQTARGFTGRKHRLYYTEKHREAFAVLHLKERYASEAAIHFFPCKNLLSEQPRFVKNQLLVWSNNSHFHFSDPSSVSKMSQE